MNRRVIKKPSRTGSITLAEARATALELSTDEKPRKRPIPGFMRTTTASGPLVALVGSSAMPRAEITKKIWGYIKRNGLQDKRNKRMINADSKLRQVFGGKSHISKFEMTKLVSKHLK